MKKEMQSALKSIFFYDVFIGILIGLFISSLLKSSPIFFFLGLFVALVNFLLNGVIINFVTSLKKLVAMPISSILTCCKIILIAYVGLLIYKDFPMGCLYYLLGFCSHFISFILYAVINNILLERK